MSIVRTIRTLIGTADLTNVQTEYIAQVVHALVCVAGLVILVDFHLIVARQVGHWNVSFKGHAETCRVKVEIVEHEVDLRSGSVLGVA